MDKTPVYEVDVFHTFGKIKVANFSGHDTGGRFGSKGKRYFLANLYEEDAERLRALGFPVGIYEGKKEGDVPTPFIKVFITYRNNDGSLKPEKYLPNVYCVVDGEPPQFLDETTIGTLDTFMDGYRITDCSFRVNLSYPYGNPVVYLDTGYFICTKDNPGANREYLRVDPFAEMYNK